MYGTACEEMTHQGAICLTEGSLLHFGRAGSTDSPCAEYCRSVLLWLDQMMVRLCTQQKNVTYDEGGLHVMFEDFLRVPVDTIKVTLHTSLNSQISNFCIYDRYNKNSEEVANLYLTLWYAASLPSEIQHRPRLLSIEFSFPDPMTPFTKDDWQMKFDPPLFESIGKRGAEVTTRVHSHHKRVLTLTLDHMPAYRNMKDKAGQSLSLKRELSSGRMVENWRYPPAQKDYWTYDSEGYHVNGFKIFDPESDEDVETYFKGQLKKLKAGFIPYGEQMDAFLQTKM